MGYWKKELAPDVERQPDGASVMPVIPALQPITSPTITTVIVGTGQKEIHDLLALIRPEFSHLNNGNGKRITILARLAAKFQKVDELVKRHTPDRLGAQTMEAINKERRRYDMVLIHDKTATA